MTRADLDEFLKQATTHRQEHACGGVPYQNAELLISLSKKYQPDFILELGTGIGYSATCLLYGYPHSQIDTIDQDLSHLIIANNNWKRLGLVDNITTFNDKAEAVLPRIKKRYDLIFADGYDPSLKFLMHFERVLKKDGILITANLFLKDKEGGRYLRKLKNKRYYTTDVTDDTAISIKLF